MTVLELIWIKKFKIFLHNKIFLSLLKIKIMSGMKKMVLMPVAVQSGSGKRGRGRPKGSKNKKGGSVYAPNLASMPVGAVSVIGGRKMTHMGGGFFGDLWSGIKKGVSYVADKALPIANDMLKKSGLVSTGLSMLPGVGGIASNIARSQGYGKRGRPRKVGGKKTYRAIKG